MKLRELLNERISLAPHGPEVLSGVRKTTLSVIRNIYNRNSELLQDKNTAIQFVNLVSTGLIQAYPKLLQDYSKSFVKSIPNITITEIDTDASFQSETNTIIINKHLIGKISNLYVNKVYNEFHKKPVQPATNSLISSLLQKVAYGFIHELTHFVQFSKSDKHRERSYIKNKDDAIQTLVAAGYTTKDAREEFLKSENITLDKLGLIIAKADLTNPKNRAVYIGQPEEIAAFAQQFVSGEISRISNLPVEKQLIEISKIMQVLVNKTDYAELLQSDDPAYKKVVRRFIKEIYQELDAYRDSITQ